MASKGRYFKRKKITLFKQLINLKAEYPGSFSEIKGSTLKWCGKIKPTALSEEYNILIKYSWGKSPESWVFGENLKKLDSPDFPHNFKIDKDKKKVRICLYHPKNDEWNPSQYISKTIIPWSVEWLYFYDVWLSTGKWYGGGIHPDNKDENSIIK